jgi:hypothetical protein
MHAPAVNADHAGNMLAHAVHVFAVHSMFYSRRSGIRTLSQKSSLFSNGWNSATSIILIRYFLVNPFLASITKKNLYRRLLTITNTSRVWGFFRSDFLLFLFYKIPKKKNIHQRVFYME